MLSAKPSSMCTNKSPVHDQIEIAVLSMGGSGSSPSFHYTSHPIITVHENDQSEQGVSAERLKAVRIWVVEDPMTSTRLPDLA